MARTGNNYEEGSPKDINAYVSYSADTNMCTLTFKCAMWPWPLRYGSVSRSLHIVAMRTTFVPR